MGRNAVQVSQNIVQGRDILEYDVRTDRPRTVRTKPKIEEFATLVRANRSQSVDDLAAAVEICHGTFTKFCLMT